MIELGKTYTNMHGRNVEIFHLLETSLFPYVGIESDCSGYQSVEQFDANGYARTGSHLVLPEETYFLNIYPDNDVYKHETLEDANLGNSKDRGVTLKITVANDKITKAELCNR